AAILAFSASYSKETKSSGLIQRTRNSGAKSGSIPDGAGSFPWSTGCTSCQPTSGDGWGTSAYPRSTTIYPRLTAGYGAGCGSATGNSGGGAAPRFVTC